MRILVVEDDPEHSTQVCGYLKRKGFEVLSAQTSAEAELYANEYAIDAVTVDLALPDCSGVELIKRLRKKKPMLPNFSFISAGQLAR